MTTAHAPTGINTASLLEARAAQLPDKIALVHDGDRITFAQLDETINRFANYFRARGIKKGHKVVLFIQPSIEFSAVTFALFKLGAVPVFIDPGMGVKNLRGAVAQVTPDALIAIPKGLMLAKVFRKDFASAGIKLNATKLRAVTKDESASFDKYLAPADEMAAILFTSGGTGTPKGVVYTHQIFINQTQMLQEMFDLTPEDVDFPCFSLFGFFTLAMGLTSHIPPINPTKLQDLDPRELVNMMKQHKVTFAAGSPLIWDRVADYCIDQNLKMPDLKSLVMFGAPVNVEMHEKWHKILPHGSTYTPYGATEALPISNISGNYILENTAAASRDGAGTCIGTAVPGIDIRIINGDEIVVAGDVVTQHYFGNEAATRASKLEIDGKLFHKMGDVGRLDEQGRLWFYGRDVHVVESDAGKMYSTCCEIPFLSIPEVKNAALVGPEIGGGVVPSLVVELADGTARMTNVLLSKLKDVRDEHQQCQAIERFYLKEEFPVDVRHNIKIDRLALRDWVEQSPSRYYS